MLYSDLDLEDFYLECLCLEESVNNFVYIVCHAGCWK